MYIGEDAGLQQVDGLVPRTSSASSRAEVMITAMSRCIMPLSVIRWITSGCKKPITVDKTASDLPPETPACREQ